jgi:microcystin-dependent protein
MAEPFIGQIQPFGFNFAPRNWALCNGQILSISQNTALFSLLGTMYGGNGTTNFALPNLQSRVPLHMGQQQGITYFQGEESGAETVTLTINTMPGHNHAFAGTSDPANSVDTAAGASLAAVAKPSPPAGSYYAVDTAPQPINPASISMTGGNLPHNNIQPYQAINWCIALSGIFPTRP